MPVQRTLPTDETRQLLAAVAEYAADRLAPRAATNSPLAWEPAFRSWWAACSRR